MKLLTITGVDERTDADWIKRMGRKYLRDSGHSAVEFAILRSPKVGQSPRYPTQTAIRKITRYVYPNQLAFHLCGRYARMVFEMEWAELCDIVDFSLVSRVQVNSFECDAAAMLTLQRFSVHIGLPVVMQWRCDPFPCVPGVHFLQDRSGGRGLPETDWFSPDDLCVKAGSRVRIGYAGGLRPENIQQALSFMATAARGKYFWVDCESGVRSGDWLDQEKAEAMMAAVTEHRSGRRAA